MNKTCACNVYVTVTYWQSTNHVRRFDIEKSFKPPIRIKQKSLRVDNVCSSLSALFQTAPLNTHEYT